MAYSRNLILEKCEKALLEPKTFYQSPMINYRGKTIDTDEFYSEIIAEFVCEHLDVFSSGIPTITRICSYKTSGHDGKYNESSNREEEKLAMQMFTQSLQGYAFDHIGKIIDYQTPLKSTRSDVVGKIDLLAYDGSTLHILELKKQDSEETMLRCVLEGYTYLRTADHIKLLEDFKLPSDTVIKASPFVFRNGVQHQELMGDRPQLNRLINLLDSKPYFIEKKNESFFVTED